MSTQAQVLAPSIGPADARARSTGGRPGRAVWNFLARVGEQRARAEMLRLAAGYALTQPALAAQLRAAARERRVDPA